MAMVLLALAPAFLVSIYVFGFRVVPLTLICIVASVFFEWAWNKLMKRRQTVGDLSAAVTGTLIAFNVPSGLPFWMAVVGCFVAIVIVKQLFGGIGKNVANPCDRRQDRAALIFCYRNDHMAGAENGSRRHIYGNTSGHIKRRSRRTSFQYGNVPGIHRRFCR